MLVFDADHAGRSGSQRLGGLLERRGLEPIELAPPVEHNDLNAWARHNAGWAEQIDRTISTRLPARAIEHHDVAIEVGL